MKDEFKRLEKNENIDGAPQSKRKLGCPCCRKHPNLAEHRKYSRKQAKKKLREKDRRDFKNEN